MKHLKQIKYIFITVFSLCISSQQFDSTEFDKDYLESLPDAIRDDILKESKKAKEEDKESLKSRPSSELLKLDVVRNWEEFQRKKEDKSERYGINLFRTMQSSFMPVNEPNFGNNAIDLRSQSCTPFPSLPFPSFSSLPMSRRYLMV